MTEHLLQLIYYLCSFCCTSNKTFNKLSLYIHFKPVKLQFSGGFFKKKIKQEFLIKCNTPFCLQKQLLERL
jgi:hypothetical protein